MIAHLKTIKVSAYIIVSLSFICSKPLVAQIPTSTVYHVDIKKTGGLMTFTTPNCLSSFNKVGYNNQPRFFSRNEVYFTVGIDTQAITQIYKVNLEDQKTTIVTDSEGIAKFSPTPMPDGKHWSTTRIEKDGMTQTLWMYPKNQKSVGKRLHLSTIGYYSWLSEDSVAVFLVNEKNTLAIANTKNENLQVIAEDIGRCLRSTKPNTLLYVQKKPESLSTLLEYNTLTGSVTTLAMMPKDREDFEILVDGTVMIGDGSKIKILEPKTSKWREVADVANMGLNNINRIHSFEDRIVFVNNQP
jgi:hypothetical protein